MCLYIHTLFLRLNQHEHLISGKGNKDENVAADIGTKPHTYKLIIHMCSYIQIRAYTCLHTYMSIHTVDVAIACIAAMQDKIAGVRLSSESLLAALMSRGVVTKNMLDKATRDLPTGTHQYIYIYIYNIR